MKRIYIFLVLAVALTALSCRKEFLDIEDNTQLYRQSYVKDLATMKEFLNGIYQLQAMNFKFGNAAAYPEIIADNLKPADPAGGSLSYHYAWRQVADKNAQANAGVDPSSTATNGMWLTGYKMIRACNFIIEETGKYRSSNPQLADDLLGQAYAIRALTHFTMVNVYAQHFGFTPGASHPGIPYITTSDVTRPYSRQTVAEVYGFILNDYQKAIELLPAGIRDARYLNKTAVKALLARAYLYKEDYGNAKAVALEVTGEVPLTSVAAGYPKSIFQFKATPQTEVLFQLSPGIGAAETYFLGVMLGSWGLFNATGDIADILKENNNDVRNTWVSGTPGTWKVTKFPANAAPEVPGIGELDGAYYHCVVRSSEMFLTVAEAAAKSSDENTARQYIYEIRHRADPSVTLPTESGEALLALIYKERRKELCFEEQRMFDLQRWKKGVQRVDAPLAYAKDLVYPSNKAVAPIPLPDVELNGLPQNLDY